MELAWAVAQMSLNAERIRALLRGIPAAQARWRPEPESWSMLEVVNHLLDEEREDFKVRLDYTLHRPGEPWPAIDPEGWVTAREYNERDLEPSLAAFLRERDASLAWLGGLATTAAPDWEAAYETSFGPIRAGDVLAAWVAHDLLHIRQLVELHWAYTTATLAPYKPDYAGVW
ncbi:MAG: DinB family protein [Anaerolineae bacterium]